MPINVIDKIKPANEGGFAVADAEDIEYNGARLPELLPVILTQDEYDALAAEENINEKTLYLIVERDET